MLNHPILGKINKYLFIKISFLIALVLVLLFVTVNGIFIKSSYYQKTENLENLADKKYVSLNLEKVEIADSDQARSYGLMNRKEICDQCIAIFTFEDEAVRNFWMKNTLVSLDIIFIDKKGKIIKISENTKPNQTNETYSSVFPAKYVIEGGYGFAKKNLLEPGQYLDIPKIISTSVPLKIS